MKFETIKAVGCRLVGTKYSLEKIMMYTGGLTAIVGSTVALLGAAMHLKDEGWLIGEGEKGKKCIDACYDSWNGLINKNKTKQ